jgi:hypothetical protein
VRTDTFSASCVANERVFIAYISDRQVQSSVWIRHCQCRHQSWTRVPCSIMEELGEVSRGSAPEWVGLQLLRFPSCLLFTRLSPKLCWNFLLWMCDIINTFVVYTHELLVQIQRCSFSLDFFRSKKGAERGCYICFLFVKFRVWISVMMPLFVTPLCSLNAIAAIMPYERLRPPLCRSVPPHLSRHLFISYDLYSLKQYSQIAWRGMTLCILRSW